MAKCDYVMCDGYDCTGKGVVKRDGKRYCKDHIIALDTGIDPMYNEEYDNE